MTQFSNTEQWGALPPGSKVVGHRRPARADLRNISGLFRFATEMRKGKRFVPRGVYRFKTFEEAEEWQLKMMTRF